jgi:hypothetical protein
MVDGDLENGRSERVDDCMAILCRLVRDKQIAQDRNAMLPDNGSVAMETADKKRINSMLFIY